MNDQAIQQHRWRRRYAEGDTPWDRGAPSPALIEWLEGGCVPGPAVLAPGCGRGHEVVELAARGFRVTGIDFVEEAIDDLRRALAERNLEATLHRADFLNWRPDAPFDAVYEQTSLCALPPSQWPDYERCLFDWLKPGGVLLALFMQTGRGGGPPWHCDPVAMQRLFKPPRWRWRERREELIEHPSGLREMAAVLIRADRQKC